MHVDHEGVGAVQGSSQQDSTVNDLDKKATGCLCRKMDPGALQECCWKQGLGDGHSWGHELGTRVSPHKKGWQQLSGGKIQTPHGQIL